METFSALLAICAGKSPVTGEFPAQRPVTWSFDVFFDLCQNKHLSKQWRGWWFETPSSPSWCLCNVMIGNHLRCWYQHETHNNWHLRLYGWITQYYVYSISLLITNSPRIFGKRVITLFSSVWHLRFSSNNGFEIYYVLRDVFLSIWVYN